MSAIIDQRKCVLSGGCKEVCPVAAIYFDEKQKKMFVNKDLCIQCGICVGACPIGAITLASSDTEYEKLKKEFEKK